MELNEEQFKQAEADFRRLQKDQQLPPLMELKLAFLKALIAKAPEAHDIGERLQHFQSESIQELPRQTQQKLFIQIVGCLSGRESVTYCKSERVYIRREGKIFPWEKFYLDCDTNSLTFKRKRDGQDYEYKFELQKLSLSKYYKKYKGKEVMALDYDGTKYVVGFDEEISCKRVHRMVGELVEQKRQWMVTKFDNVHYIQQKENERLALPAHRIKQIMNHEQYQFLLGLEQKIKGVDLIDDAGFKIYKNIPEGRVMVGPNGAVKSQFLVKKVSPEQLASRYLQMTSWNPEIDLFQITGRPRRNCLLARLRTKKYSLISYQREAMLAINFFRPCHCQDKQPSSDSYLLIEDLPTEEKPAGRTVRMSFRQIIQFLPNRDDPDLLLVVIYTEAKFKGYSTESDTSEMTLHFTEQIDKFLSFVYSDTETPSGYFSDTVCPCGGKDALEFLTDMTLPTDREQLQNQPERLSLKTLTLNYDFSPKRVIGTMEDICNGLVNEQFLQILKHHAHESYYLRHRFSDADESFHTYKEENRNFLMEGTRWQLQGDELKFIDKEVLAAQKDILKMILKQLSTNIMQGKSIMSMSLPVEIFDKRSLLDAIADSYGFVAAFEKKIVTATDPIEQMKYLICSFMFVNATCPGIEKPFNPILGETYQGKLGTLPVFLEQTSHHPAISTILIKTPQLQISGNIDIVIDMGLNSAHSYLCHWLKAKVMSTGTEYLIKIPEITMEGIIYGDRVYKVSNKGFILEVNNNLFAEFSVGKTKKRVYQCKSKLNSSDIVGGIFRVKQEFAEKVKAKPKPKSFQGLRPQHIIETCSLLTGKWYGDISFDGVPYKSKAEGPFPLKSERMKYVLPSDSVWREDLVHKIWKDNERSNREKERMQNLQRNDRKLREKFKKMR